MVGKEIILENAITDYEAKEILEKIESEYAKKEKNLGYELEQSLKYVKSKKDITNLKEKQEKLTELGISKRIVIELLNVNSTKLEVIKTILLKRGDENLASQVKDILDLQ